MLDLTGLERRPTWDETIREELSVAGIEYFTNPGAHLPTYRLIASLTGKLGSFPMHRNEKSWIMWCKVPLASAEVIAADPICVAGMRSGEHAISNPTSYAAWLDDKGNLLLKDEGESKEHKECILHDLSGALFCGNAYYVEDPEKIGIPFVLGYEFTTVEALKRFAEILRRHRVVPV